MNAPVQRGPDIIRSIIYKKKLESGRPTPGVLMGGFRKFRRGGGGGGPSIPGTSQGVQMLLEVVRTSISKETYTQGHS